MKRRSPSPCSSSSSSSSSSFSLSLLRHYQISPPFSIEFSLSLSTRPSTLRRRFFPFPRLAHVDLITAPSYPPMTSFSAWSHSPFIPPFSSNLSISLVCEHLGLFWEEISLRPKEEKSGAVRGFRGGLWRLKWSPTRTSSYWQICNAFLGFEGLSNPTFLGE